MKDKKFSKHRKYDGRKLPKYQCLTCLAYYDILHSNPRMPIKPTRKMKDKSKYNRKEKHKK